MSTGHDRFGRARASLLTKLDPGSSDNEKPITGKKLGSGEPVKLYLLTGEMWFCDEVVRAEEDPLSLPITYTVCTQVKDHPSWTYPFASYMDRGKTLKDFHTDIYRAFSRSCGDLFWVTFTIGSKPKMYFFEFYAEENPFS